MRKPSRPLRASLTTLLSWWPSFVPLKLALAQPSIAAGEVPCTLRRGFDVSCLDIFWTREAQDDCMVSSMIETLQFFPTVPTSYLSRIRACATWIIWNFAFTSVQASCGTSYYARFFQIQSMFWSNLLLVTVEDVEAKGPVTSCNWSTSSHPLLFGRCDSRWQRQPVFHSSRSRNLSQRRGDMDEVMYSQSHSEN